jgi:predicted aldo/keto reductase-like oxidoreductase
MLDLYPWDFCQIQFNYVDKDIQQGMQGYQELIKRNIPIVVMEPLKGGSLAKFNETVEAKFKARSSDSMAKWAFRWVSSMPGVKVALSGMNE